MGIRYFVFAVNKMDLVGYSEERFREIEAQIAELRKELDLENGTSFAVCNRGRQRDQEVGEYSVV